MTDKNSAPRGAEETPSLAELIAAGAAKALGSPAVKKTLEAASMKPEERSMAIDQAAAGASVKFEEFITLAAGGARKILEQAPGPLRDSLPDLPAEDLQTLANQMLDELAAAAGGASEQAAKTLDKAKPFADPQEIAKRLLALSELGEKERALEISKMATDARDTLAELAQMAKLMLKARRAAGQAKNLAGELFKAFKL